MGILNKIIEDIKEEKIKKKKVIILGGTGTGMVRRYIKPVVDIKIREVDCSLLFHAFLNENKIGEMKCVIHSEENYIFVGDIEINRKYRGLGIGTMMMNRLFEYAQSLNIGKITGNLSTVDDEEQLLHFYGKFNFKITMLDNVKRDNTFAVIEKYL